MTSESTTSTKQSGGMARLAIFATVCIDLLGFAIVLPLLPRYGEFYNASGPVLGLLMASFSAMQFLCAPLWGRLSDRIGRRRVLIIGLIGSTLSYLFFGVISQMQPTDIWLGLGPISWLFVTRIGAGIAGATIPTAQAYIADTTDESNRGRGMALIGAAFGVGFTFGPLIGAAWVSDDPNAGPSSMPGYMAAGLSFIAAIFAFIVLKESRSSHDREAAIRVTGLESFRRALSAKSVVPILIAIFLTTFAFAQFESTLSLLTYTMGVSDRRNFLLFAYIGFILALAQGGLVRPLLGRIGEYRMLVAGTLAMTIGLWLISVAGQRGSVSMLYWVMPITIVGFSAVTPSLQSMLSLQSSSDQQGEVLGVGQSISALARILGPAIGLAIFSETHVEYPYWFGAGVMAFALLMVIWFCERSSNSVDDIADNIERGDEAQSSNEISVSTSTGPESI